MTYIDLDGEKYDVSKSLFEIDKALCEASLVDFIKQAWHVVEPGQPYAHNWHIDMIADHLTAIADEVMIDDEKYYNRLLINVPPGTMKSLIVGVFWPSWIWGPRNEPSKRFLCTSYGQNLAIRDSLTMRRLVTSEWYQERWGDRVIITDDQNEKKKFQNSAYGFRQATAFESMTGARADFVIIDDPHSVDSAASEALRRSTIDTFEQSVPTRLTNPDKSAIVVIMQRLHEEDVSGVILSKKLGYDHIMLPMEYDPDRAAPTMLGWKDPRREKGELLFPARFPRHVVDREKHVMGRYAIAGQFQQEPTSDDMGIIKRGWWQVWDKPMFPPLDYIIASVDTAYTEKTENDFSAMTVWGVFTRDPSSYALRQSSWGGNVQELRTYSQQEVAPSVILIHAWAEHLAFSDLVRKIAEECIKWKVTKLLVENKAAGMPVATELRRLYSRSGFSVQLDDPGSTDKMARLYSVQHLFEDGLIYAPDMTWADDVIVQCMRFPKAKHDDLVDCVSMALRYLRRTGLIMRAQEVETDYSESVLHRGLPPPPLYGV